MSDYTFAIEQAEWRIKSHKKMVRQYWIWSAMLWAGAAQCLLFAFIADKFFGVFVIPSAYGAVAARKLALEEERQLKHWKDEHFLWSAARELQSR